MLFTYAFVPHDFLGFHGMRPVFGALFTLLLPALLFVPASRRLWLLVLWTHLGIATWFLTSHADRFLQALVPWMAAATAAIVVLAWRHLKVGRVAVAGLVLFQVVDGADVYFLRTHGMIGDSPLRSVVEHLSAGTAGAMPIASRSGEGCRTSAGPYPRGRGC